MTEHKRCAKCRIYKPMDAFNNNSTRTDGKAGRCRDCTREYWHAARAGKIIARSGPRGTQALWLLGADRQVNYAANQRRWAELAAGVRFGGR